MVRKAGRRRGGGGFSSPSCCLSVATMLGLPCFLVAFVSVPQGTLQIKPFAPGPSCSAARCLSQAGSSGASYRQPHNQPRTSFSQRRQRQTTKRAMQDVGTGLSLAMENAKQIGKGDMANLELVADPNDSVRRSGVLERAYKECERITGIFAKTFYLGTRFMPPVARYAIWAIYVWCRRTDDIVDGPRAMMRGMESMQEELDDWTARLEDIWTGKPRDSLDLALVDVKQKYPTLDIAPFKDMIDGMLMDIPGMGKTRYEDFKELELYCYRVAGTVGLMTLPILGTAKGVTEEQAKEPALCLGVALQLTNILRDVGEDAVRGRIYLPLTDLEKFGVTEQNIMNGVLDDNYTKLMKYQIARARFYYRKAKEGIAMLSPEAAFPVQASLDMYGKILAAIEDNGYDNFRKRAYVSKSEKLFTLPFSYLRSKGGPDLLTPKPSAGEESLSFELTRHDKLSPHQADKLPSS